jgi:hypothetical protein
MRIEGSKGRIIIDRPHLIPHVHESGRAWEGCLGYVPRFFGDWVAGMWGKEHDSDPLSSEEADGIGVMRKGS